MGRCHAPAGEAVASLLSGLLLRWRLAARTGLEAGHSGRAVGFAWPSSSAIRRSNRSITRCCSRTVACQLGDDGDEDSAVGGDQVTLSIHSLYMT